VFVISVEVLICKTFYLKFEILLVCEKFTLKVPTIKGADMSALSFKLGLGAQVHFLSSQLQTLVRVTAFMQPYAYA
jgi:hypothetical protein